MHPPTRRRTLPIVQTADQVIQDVGLLENAYFQDLASGELSRSEFLMSQRQFYFAVAYFSRPMMALAARLELPEQRLGLLENIVEEHGGFHPDAFHEATFRQFLGTIGGSGERPAAEEAGPSVLAFNATLMGVCQTRSVATAACCLGIIEYAFADLSALIGRCVVQHGWVAEDDLVHYKLHAEIDKQHAADLFEIAVGQWEDPRQRPLLVQGLRLGADAFDRLYRGLRAHPPNH
ncbi:iron-containing redox enzyme family protein [Roseiconus nitratireducens]|uniref:Iron-containing redox enzyme family protein n=1 Tax=Roseiconus nitratireducens TaxID=2605748 RepID=A0A5M6D8A1_9BACT|nr:iron-containing redox enzyme family protein [Roseiconus nitratireducens]KAA5543761.1 iron-containing redox enzyme family protein [Roseiconus nitratireducens]